MQVDLEIKKTLRRLRKEARVNTMAIERQQTLKELAAQIWFYTFATNIQWSCRRRSSCSSQGVPYGLRWHETEWS